MMTPEQRQTALLEELQDQCGEGEVVEYFDQITSDDPTIVIQDTGESFEVEIGDDTVVVNKQISGGLAEAGPIVEMLHQRFGRTVRRSIDR